MLYPSTDCDIIQGKSVKYYTLGKEKKCDMELSNLRVIGKQFCFYINTLVTAKGIIYLSKLKYL